MRFFVVFLILAALPLAHAQEGLFVSLHNMTHHLGENEYLVEEVIVFENTGSSYGNLFRETVYLARGDARDVMVEAKKTDLKYSVENATSTIININLVLWRGEKREVTIKYNRSDMLFSEDTIHSFSGPALGRYSWIPDRAAVKFIAPEGFQFGDVTPPARKTIENSKEVLTYDLSPINLENLTAIREGVFTVFEYAKYDEMATAEMIAAREFLEEAEFDLAGANKSVENALEHIPDKTQILTVLEIARTALDEAKNALDLAEIKSNSYSNEYSPHGAYYYAKHSRNLSRESSRKAEEAKDLANYGIQQALEEKISGIGSKLQEQSDTEAVLAPKIDRIPGIEEGPWAGYGLAAILILAAVVVFDIYRRSGGHRVIGAPKKGKVGDFRAIDELKHKSFKGFDKKLDTVKSGTGLAKEIRDQRKKKEKLEFEREKLQRRLEREEITEDQFDSDNEDLKREINETSSKIDELKSRLNELKKVSK